MANSVPQLKIKSRQLKQLVMDPQATAKAVSLVYVNCSDEGIQRIKSGKGFRYIFRNKTVKDKSELQRIRSLVLPPAWTDVWICTIANGHLQATGKDVRGRKQYRYHPSWNACRNQTKFFKLLELGTVLPDIRKQVAKDLSLSGLPRDKVLAAVISLMEKTGIRIGSEFYEKLYGSFGLTTLKDKHVSINGSTVHFCFKGKKGVEHRISLKSKKLSRIVQHCRDIPGKELFQYYDEDGNRQAIESGMVNEYLKRISGAELTAKDLRTWCGSVTALEALTEAGGFESEHQAKRKIAEALDKVSSRLGNSRTVCKKYYVHPCLVELYEKNELEKWATKKENNSPELSAEENTLLCILKSIV
jgi:DNA topoisomerase-1